MTVPSSDRTGIPRPAGAKLPEDDVIDVHAPNRNCPQTVLEPDTAGPPVARVELQAVEREVDPFDVFR